MRDWRNGQRIYSKPQCPPDFLRRMQTSGSNIGLCLRQRGIYFCTLTRIGGLQGEKLLSCFLDQSQLLGARLAQMLKNFQRTH